MGPRPHEKRRARSPSHHGTHRRSVFPEGRYDGRCKCCSSLFGGHAKEGARTIHIEAESLLRSPTQPAIQIPWAIPPVGEEEAEAARATVAANRLSMGQNVAEFEAAMARYASRRHALAVSNGTDALEVAVGLLGIGPGDEVLVSSLSYIATVNCILRAGATPVFCDVVPDTLNIDVEDARRRTGPATRAIIIADYCGFAVDYDGVVSLCQEAGLRSIVDGAQSIGTYYRGRPALAFGDIATTSFHSAKIMTTGEGGMVFLDDDALLDRARRMRGQGEVPGRKYIHDTLGFNHRITDIQAAIGLVQLQKLPSFCSSRSNHAQRYSRLLSEVAGLQLLLALPDSIPAWFSFPILVDDRDALAAHLLRAGIETRSLYPIPTYRQPVPGYPPVSSARPAAEAAAARVLNIPMFAQLTEEQIDEVGGAIAAFLDQRR
jgi:dTDP-4-amino-4,6-dideoxygalactose transaminase